MRYGRRVAVIGGGTTCEHDVSLASAAAAAQALESTGWETLRVTIERDGGWILDGAPSAMAGVIQALGACDAVVPMVHGAGGEDGTLAALCDLVRVPYTGSGVRAGAIAMDKAATKALATSLGIATARGTVVQRGADAVASFGGPVVVKPVAAGSSFGVSRVDRSADLAEALAAAWQFDEAALVEELVVGREIGLAVCAWEDGEPQATSMLEVLGEGLFDSTRKYDGTARFVRPTDLTQAVLADARAQAIALYTALGCAGPARIDFFLTASGWVLNEVNTTPGMTVHSQVPMMYAAQGVTYPELIARMVESALRRAPATV